MHLYLLVRQECKISCFKLDFFFNTNLCFQVDTSKVNVDSLKPWIAQRITELLGMEDDVIVEFVYNQLEVRVMALFLVIFIVD